jgi:translation initiation factor IF-3
VGSDGSQVGLVSLQHALEMAQKETLDLVEISPDAEPPVCKLMDYGKHVFDIKKKVALQRKKTKADTGQRNEVSSGNGRG